MAVIPNTWVEKVKKKRTHETAPSYESYSSPEVMGSKKPTKRHTNALKTNLVKTLRGVRK